jgi:glucose-1-phosphate adenylyltransferase
MVLAGGRGSRLNQLTEWRAKPAVPFGGKHRIIDFALSNCVNSGIRRIGVATQYKAHSLIQHLQRGWSFLDADLGEFLEVLPAQQRVDGAWYMGTANAVLQNLDIIHAHAPRTCWCSPVITSTRWTTPRCSRSTWRAMPT